ncbi:MAG: hypothetical protein ACJA0X_001055 [Cyclobacteriaceae bacterium]|jgi:hypothetical protein
MNVNLEHKANAIFPHTHYQTTQANACQRVLLITTFLKRNKRIKHQRNVHGTDCICFFAK